MVLLILTAVLWRTKKCKIMVKSFDFSGLPNHGFHLNSVSGDFSQAVLIGNRNVFIREILY